jgi:hypothetical protein
MRHACQIAIAADAAVRTARHPAPHRPTPEPSASAIPSTPATRASADAHPGAPASARGRGIACFTRLLRAA